MRKIISIILILVLIEIALSFRYGSFYNKRTPIILHDDYLGYVLNPHLNHTYNINSWGFRGEELKDAKIFAVGDSTTFGYKLDDVKQAYPCKLSTLLKKEVVNAGVPGYTSLHTLRQIKRLLMFKPELIILCIGKNDLEFSYEFNWSPKLMLYRYPPPKLAVVRCLRKLLRTFKVKHQREINPAAFNYFKANLNETIQLLKKHRVRLLVLAIPTVVSENMTYNEEQKAKNCNIKDLMMFQTGIAEICKQTDTPYFEIFGLGMTSKDAYFIDHCHFTEKGAEYFAEQIWRVVRIVKMRGR